MDRRTLFVDVDDTLLSHDLSSFPSEDHIEIHNNGRSFFGVINSHNVNLLVKFYRLGYDVYVWSKTGKSWAEAVVKELDLAEFVEGCMSKPDFYLDDKAVDKWIGPRLWRDPISGKEQGE